MMGKRKDEIMKAIVGTVNKNADAIREHAVATQRLSDMTERQAQAQEALRKEMHDEFQTLRAQNGTHHPVRRVPRHP